MSEDAVATKTVESGMVDDPVIAAEPIAAAGPAAYPGPGAAPMPQNPAGSPAVNVAHTVYMAAAPVREAPVKAMWICLALAWVFFIMPIPLTILIASPLNIAVIILSIICLVREATLPGVLGLVGSTIGSTLIYLLGLALTALVMGGGAAAMSAPR